MKHKARPICILLSFILLLAAIPFSAQAKNESVTADGINVARGEGMLIIYTPEMGKTTGTNEWGCEAVVSNNIVKSVGGGNKEIPSDGFVISGHDMDAGGKQMGTWIRNNVSVGDYVYYNDALAVTVSDKPIETSSFYEVTTKYNNLNGTRNEDYIVIYNRLGQSTGTNDWGYEVVCSEGVVTLLGGNDNKVPSEAGSFVVSGHGKNAEWLKTNVKLGMKAIYDTSAGTVTFTYDESSALSGTEMNVSELESEYKSALEEYRYIDFASAKSTLDSLKSRLNAAESKYKKDKNAEELAEECNAIDADVESAFLMLSESRTVEYRGVWIRPTQKTQDEVDAYVAQLKENGINMISVETLYACTMIMPMPEGSLFEQNPMFGGFDVLQAYIDACHKREMELHIWLPIFYVGDAGNSNAKRSVGTKKPEWLSIPNTGKSVETAEGFMMLNPASEEAQNYLLSTYEYILGKYDIDGFQLDYIRYYARTAEADFGYNPEILEAFREKYNITPTYDTGASYWSNWVQFRADYITAFVARIRKLIDTVAPDVLLGADVVPDPSEAKGSNYQDYAAWLEKGYIDILHPMAYGYGFEDEIAQQVTECGTNAFIAVGMGIFTPELTPSDMQSQASGNIKLKTDGSVYFEASSYLSKKTGSTLLAGVYRNEAITPRLNPEKTVKTALEYAKNRINDVIVPQNGLSRSDADGINAAIDALAATASEKGVDKDKYTALISAVEASGAKDGAKTAILADIAYAVKVFSVIDKELDLSDVPDYSGDPLDQSNPTDAESSIAGSASDVTSASVESEEGSDSGATTTVILICAIACVAIIAVFLIIRNRKAKK